MNNASIKPTSYEVNHDITNLQRFKTVYLTTLVLIIFKNNIFFKFIAKYQYI